MSEVRQRLVKGTVWLSCARLLVNGLTILSTFVLARLLAPSDFGLVALGTTMMLLVTEFTELSLAEALVRHIAPTRKHFDTAWTLNALRATVLGGGFAAIGPLAADMYGDPRLLGIMLALGASIFLAGLANPKRVLLTRELIFWQDFAVNVGQKLAGVGSSLAVAYYYQSYWALVVGILVAQVANIAISYLILPYLPRPRFVHARELFSFSLWLTAVRMVDALNWRFDILLVGKFLGSTALGHYSVGNTLATIPTRETTAPLRQTFFPAFSSMRDDNARMAAAYQRAQSVLTMIALPAGIGTALIADPLIRLVMGEQWAPAIVIVQALAAVFALQTLGSSADSIAMAKGETKLLFLRSSQMLLVRIPLILGGLHYFGMTGLIGARILTGAIGIAVNLCLVRRLLGLSVGSQLQSNRRSLLGAALMALATLATLAGIEAIDPSTHLLFKLLAAGSVAVACYGFAVAALWKVAKQPSGPEAELAGILGQVWLRLRPRMRDQART